MREEEKRILDILIDLQNSIEEIKKVWIAQGFYDEEGWRAREALCWMHGATNVGERNELESWLIHPQKPSETAKSFAVKHIDMWKAYIEGNPHPELHKEALCKLKGEVFLDFSIYHLIEHYENESLLEYILRYAEKAERSEGLTKKGLLALNSFLYFIRTIYPKQEVAFIEEIVPREKIIKNYKILRKTKPKDESIPIEVAGSIIQLAANKHMNGNPKAKGNRMWTLCLLWMCLTASRVRRPKFLKTIMQTSKSALIVENSIPFFQVSTEYGPVKIRISHRFARFFEIIVEDYSPEFEETILPSWIIEDMGPLNRVLQSSIKDLSLSGDIGPITFKSFLSPPHYSGDEYR